MEKSKKVKFVVSKINVNDPIKKLEKTIDIDFPKEVIDQVSTIKIVESKSTEGATETWTTNSKLTNAFTNKDIIQRESLYLMKKYMDELVNCNFETDVVSYIHGSLYIEGLDEKLRHKMVDWMVEVFFTFHSDDNTLFIAVHILDLFIGKNTVKIKQKDIHLLILSCIFIASKMEDSCPFTMSVVKFKLGHSKYTAKMIKNMEKMILNTIEFDIIFPSTLEFIKYLIFDLNNFNQEIIQMLKLEPHIIALEETSIFFAKCMIYFNDFKCYKYFHKAIACITTGIDVLRSNSNTLNKDSAYYLLAWIERIMMSVGKNIIQDIYLKLSVCYKEFLDERKNMAINLKKSTKLCFN